MLPMFLILAFMVTLLYIETIYTGSKSLTKEQNEPKTKHVYLHTNNSLESAIAQCKSVGFLQLTNEQNEASCREVCGNEYTMLSLSPEKSLRTIVNGHMLPSGKYCVKQITKDCDSNYSLLVYTATGWDCVPVYPGVFDETGNQVACLNLKLPYLENRKNVLWDYKKNKSLDSGANLHENISEHSNIKRYRCKCGGRGPLFEVPSLPHLCFKNYCGPGYVEWSPAAKCVCSQGHMNVTDSTSPCSACVWATTDNIIYGGQLCHTQYSNLAQSQTLPMCSPSVYRSSQPFSCTSFKFFFG